MSRPRIAVQFNIYISLERDNWLFIIVIIVYVTEILNTILCNVDFTITLNKQH